MSSLRAIARTLAAALAFALAAAPLAASAEEKAPPPPKVQKIDKKKHGKGEFPIEAAKFDEIVEKRIAGARAHMEEMLAGAPLPEATKAQIRKDFEAGATSIRAAAKEAGKDGKVTRDEAKDVRELAKDLKEEAREKYGKQKAGGDEK